MPCAADSGTQGWCVAVYLSSKVCHNCGTTNTPLWRKYQGLDMCNACGVSPAELLHVHVDVSE